MFVIDATQPDHNEPGGHPASQPLDPTTARARRVVNRQHHTALAALLTAQRDAETHITRADGKATALLGLFGAALAGALALAHTTHTLVATVLLAAATLPLLASVAALLLVLRARLGGGHGFTRWALFRQHTDALVEELTLPARHALPRHAALVADLSALALAKYRGVNTAVVLLLAGLGLLTLAVLTS
jgi:hypothetical protein